MTPASWGVVSVSQITGGMAVAPARTVNPRPEIVLPPGFALRIDYDPESSPASLLITAYHDDAPVGQAHVNPREVGQRLHLEVEAEKGAASSRALRLRLTPQRAMRAIEMSAVTQPVPPRQLVPQPEESPANQMAAHEPGSSAHPAMSAIQELEREGALGENGAWTARTRHGTNALVWLGNGKAVVLPSAEGSESLAGLLTLAGRQLRDELTVEDGLWSRMQHGLRALSSAVDLLANPLRLYDANADGWSSWRASWRAVHQPSGASEG